MISTRKAIDLPSGSKAVIRKLSARDCLELGDIPAALSEPLITNPGANGGPSKRQIEFGVKLSNIVLTKACYLLDGERRVRLSDKPFADASDGEVTIDELDQADAEKILTEVFKLSGMGKEAASAARPFPAEPEVAGDAGPGSATLRSPAEPVVEAAR